MSWIYLFLAICLEVIGTSILKISRQIISLQTLVLLLSYGLSLLFLSLALKKIDIGTAYAIWSGLGITAIEIIGILVFKEPVIPSKAVFIVLILIGTVGLNFSRSGV